jgi:hypothetical protein
VLKVIEERPSRRKSVHGFSLGWGCAQSVIVTCKQCSSFERARQLGKKPGGRERMGQFSLESTERRRRRETHCIEILTDCSRVKASWVSERVLEAVHIGEIGRTCGLNENKKRRARSPLLQLASASSHPSTAPCSCLEQVKASGSLPLQKPVHKHR